MLLLRRGSDLPVAQYCSMPRLPTSNFTFLVTKKVYCKGNKNERGGSFVDFALLEISRSKK